MKLRNFIASPLFLACGALGLAACGSGGAEPDQSSSSALATPPTTSQVGSLVSTFMSSTTRIGLIGGPGEQLFGGENIGRTQAGDAGMVWHDANTVEMLADYQLASGDAQFQSVIETYANYSGLTPFSAYGCGNSGGLNLLNCGHPNTYNDDELWWALAFLRTYDLETSLGRTALAGTFLSNAQTVFQHVAAQWNYVPNCGGGVPQTATDGPASTYLNAITNELLFETSIKLSQRLPSATNVASIAPGAQSNTYLGWAIAEYQWLKTNWWARGSIPMADGLNNATCSPVGTTLYTYNQGPVLGALLDLSNVSRTANASGLDSASTILGYGFAIASKTIGDVSNGGMAVNDILTETAETDTQCAANTDCAEFKGIFMRYLGRFTNGAAPQWGAYSGFTALATNFLVYNAATIYGNREAGYLPMDWGSAISSVSPTGASSALFQTSETSALDALIATLGLNGPPPPASPPSAPLCTYEAYDTGPAYGATAVTCTPDANNDPIYIFEWQPSTSSWGQVFSYASLLANQASMPGAGSGTTASYVGCSYKAAWSTPLTESAWATAPGVIGPGKVGCDVTSRAVSYPGAFTLSVGGGTSVYTLYLGSTIGLNVSAVGLSGEEVNVSASSLADGVTGAWSPTTLIAPPTPTLPNVPSNTNFTLATSGATATGQFTFTIAGTDGKTTQSLPITVNVEVPPSCPTGYVWIASSSECMIPVPACNAACECKAKGGSWNGTTCIVRCTTKACTCEAAGGEWNGATCS